MSKDKKNKGITLIALIVTIIVVLILASVSVAVLSNSGIIKKSKLAGETYQSKINEEEKAMQNYTSTMNEYTIADTERDTITISNEQYQNLLKEINELNNKVNDLSEETNWMELMSGVYYKKKSKYVTLCFQDTSNITIPSYTSTYSYKIATLPEGYIPQEQIFFPISYGGYNSYSGVRNNKY